MHIVPWLYSGYLIKSLVIKTVSVSFLGVYCVCVYSRTIGNTNKPITNIMKNPKIPNIALLVGRGKFGGF